MSYLGCIHTLLGVLRRLCPLEARIQQTSKLPGGCHLSANTHILTLCLTLFIHYTPSTSTMPSNKLTESATYANVSGIAESCVPADQPASFSPLYIANIRLTNLLPPSRHIVGSDPRARCRESAAMEPQFTIGEPEVRNTSLPSDIYAAWARFPRLHITQDMLENETATRGLVFELIVCWATAFWQYQGAVAQQTITWA